MQAAGYDAGIDKFHPVFGVACTAALRSATIKKGQHRLHVYVHGEFVRTGFTVVMQKGFRSRVEEDKLADQIVLWAMLHAVSPRDDGQMGPVDGFNPSVRLQADRSVRTRWRSFALQIVRQAKPYTCKFQASVQGMKLLLWKFPKELCRERLSNCQYHHQGQKSRWNQA